MRVPGDSWDDWVLLEVPGMLGVMQEAVHCWPSEGWCAPESRHRVMLWLLSLDSTCHSSCSRGGDLPARGDASHTKPVQKVAEMFL